MTFESHIRSYDAEKIIFAEGEPGEAAFIIDQGEVELSAMKNDKHVVFVRLSKGDIFGEMALIDNQLRSATAIAKTPVKLIVIHRKYIREKIDLSDKLVAMTLKVVLERYREMRSRLEHVLSGNKLEQDKMYFNHHEKEYKEDARLTTERIQAENNLKNAFEGGQLELFYQPIVSLKDDSVVGCESLIRWRHPDRGIVPPAEFIGIAEESGLIKPIGLWIVEQACQAQNEFRELAGKPIMVSINLSARQFESDHLVDDIEAVLQKTGADVGNIKLEITESLLMSNPLSVAETLHELKALGTVIALDDFGTGYSSFSYLHRFPIDTIKIDQSFVFTMRENPKSLEIVRTLCALAAALGMSVIAEGIETAEDVEVLKNFSADYGQGFYFARPMPINEFKALLQENG